MAEQKREFSVMGLMHALNSREKECMTVSLPSGKKLEIFPIIVEMMTYFTEEVVDAIQEQMELGRMAKTLMLDDNTLGYLLVVGSTEACQTYMDSYNLEAVEWMNREDERINGGRRGIEQFRLMPEALIRMIEKEI